MKNRKIRRTEEKTFSNPPVLPTSIFYGFYRNCHFYEITQNMLCWKLVSNKLGVAMRTNHVVKIPSAVSRHPIELRFFFSGNKRSSTLGAYLNFFFCQGIHLLSQIIIPRDCLQGNNFHTFKNQRRKPERKAKHG